MIFKKIQYNSPVIITFVLLSFFALLLNKFTGGWANNYLFSVYRSPVTSPLFYVRIFCHVLGHISFEHFFNNVLLILLLGPILEEKYGSKRMLLMIIFTALTTGLINILFFTTALIGASGVVFMLMILISFVNLSKGKIPLTSILVIAIFLGQEIYLGLNVYDNISQLTHIAGGICGAVLGFISNKNKLT